jgi:N-acetylglucosaminyldiphosphoundecaprenol N-acetyl-beta-D-mannosaminyltransferase
MAERIWMGRLPIDAVDFAGALTAIEELVRARAGGTVFTPNVDHIVTAEGSETFRRAYARVSLSLVDGTPVLWASRLVGHPLPEKVSGSDLMIPLVERAAAKGWRLFLLGGAPGVAAQAAAILVERFPALIIAGTDAPRIDLEGDPAERRAVAAAVAATHPDVVLVAFGSPKQELFCDEMRELLAPAVLLSVGAGIDFVAGTARRSPAWMSRWGIEWVYRLAREPRRLARRYLLKDPQFLGILLRQWRRGRAVPASSAPP